MNRMNQEIKAEWVRRLRSGAYPQGVGALNKDGRFCCLGVLCEIAADAGVVVRVEDETMGGGKVGYEDEDGRCGSSYALPRTVVKWSGMPNATGAYFEGGENVGMHTFELTMLNDSKHKTFAEIADVIEEYF